ncbi:unnamed protein product [Sympodiomycopsis kandeliae]
MTEVEANSNTKRKRDYPTDPVDEAPLAKTVRSDTKESEYTQSEVAANNDGAVAVDVKQQESDSESSRLVLPPPNEPRKRAPPAFAQPQRIASFSYDQDRKLHFDDRSRKYFHKPPLGLDLNRGYEHLVSRDESKNEHLDSLLFALMDMVEKDPNADIHRSKSTLITWRGLATKLSTAIYETRNEFKLNIMLIDDTLYIEEHLSPAAQKAKRDEEAKDPRRALWGYYGYSFESYCTSSDSQPKVGDCWDGNVNTNVQWCNIVKTRLGASERILIGGEVDAVLPSNPSSLIELKTSTQLKSPTSIINFERKLCRFYFQSFLLGVDEIHVGFRDFKGTLVDWHQFKTLEIPRCVRGKEWEWDPHRCLSNLEDTLCWIRNQIAEKKSKQEKVFRLTFKPAPPPPRAGATPSNPMPTAGSANSSGGVLTFTMATPEELEEIQGDEKNRIGFLPKRWWDFIQSRKQESPK